MTRDECLEALQSNNVQAFLRAIRAGESSQDDNAYYVMYGGVLAESLEDHPRKAWTKAGFTSTAAGAYQFLQRTWDDIVLNLGPMSFEPINQDIGAVFLINRAHALEAVKEGRFDEAIARCAKTWASLPGAGYQQRERRLEDLRQVFLDYGGRLGGAVPGSPDPQTPETRITERKEVTMAPIVLPILSALTSLIPQLGQLFGSGSEVANRNIAAASIVAQKITEVTQSVNLQEAVEKIQNDPAALQAARQAVSDVWPSITESGSGGIGAARQAAAAAASQEWWRVFVDARFYLSLLLLGLIYMAMANMTGLYGYQEWTSENRSNVVFLIVGTAIGAVTGFWFGTSHSTGAQRKTDGRLP